MAGHKGRWRGTVVSGLLALSCTPQLSDAAVTDAVEEFFEGQGVAVAGVTCPHALPRRQGAQVACSVVVQTATVSVQVEVLDAAGHVVVRPDAATLITRRLVPEISQSLRANGHAVTEVHCDAPLWVVEPGAEHRCEVTVEDGRRYAWVGVFSGRGSQHRARLVPLAAQSRGQG